MKRNSKPQADEKISAVKERSTSKNAKSRKRSRRGQRPVSEKEAVEKSSNDPVWYAQSPELLRDAASIPFSWSTGSPWKTGHSFDAIRTLPGVCALGLYQTIGETKSKYDPANVASAAIYSFVRHANSGHSNYDAPDLMMYLLGMSSIYSFITWCQRLLGLIMTYDQRNRYLPDVLIRANGVNPDSLRNNISNFRFWLNTLISKASSFAIPAVMPYFSRMAFLYSNYYIDGPSIKDQFYMFVPQGNKFLQFNTSSSTQLGFLHYTGISSASTNGSTVDEIESFGNLLFQHMWEQEDFGIMSGDILKAYGDNIIKLAPVPEMLIMQPVYDAMFMHQFKNAIVVPDPILFLGDIAVSDTGIITQQLRVRQDLTAAKSKSFLEVLSSNQLLSSDFDSPTPEVVIESTRLMPTIETDADGVTRYVLTGSEVPVSQTYWYNDRHMQAQNLYAGVLGFLYEAGEVNVDNARALARYTELSNNFKYHPRMWWYMDDITDSLGFTGDQLYRIWDVDNYAVLSIEDLKKMHEAAMMSLLAVPSIAKI